MGMLLKEKLERGGLEEGGARFSSAASDDISRGMRCAEERDSEHLLSLSDVATQHHPFSCHAPESQITNHKNHTATNPTAVVTFAVSVWMLRFESHHSSNTVLDSRSVILWRTACSELKFHVRCLFPISWDTLQQLGMTLWNSIK